MLHCYPLGVHIPGPPKPRFVLAALLLGSTLTLFSGCKSAMVDATVHNGTASPVSLIEVDYPSASFGVQVLAPNADFHYHFKIIGSGPLSLTYTDGRKVQHTVKGPDLHEGDNGRLSIAITLSGVQWTPTLHNAADPAPASS